MRSKGSTPRVAGALLRGLVRLLRSPVGDWVRRLLARRLAGPLRTARLEAPPAFDSPVQR